MIAAAAGMENPWAMAQQYWLVSGLLTNLATFFLLLSLFKQHNEKYPAAVGLKGKVSGKDIVSALILLTAFLLASLVPNLIMGRLLFGTFEGGAELLFRPYKGAVVWGIIWAVSQGMVELPFYFLFCLPLIESKFKNRTAAWLSTGFLLALQHITLPLIFSPDFILWRFSMFLPFALLVSGIYVKRPNLLPWMMGIHILLDISAAMMYLA